MWRWARWDVDERLSVYTGDIYKCAAVELGEGLMVSLIAIMAAATVAVAIAGAVQIGLLHKILRDFEADCG